MRDRARALLARQTVVAAAELRAAGVSRAALAAEVRRGEIVRLRRDRYCLPGLDARLRAAVSAGGRLDCVSELSRLGVWVSTPPDRVHVRVGPNASRLPSVQGETRHWAPPVRTSRTPSARSASVTPLDALLQAMLCLPEIDAIASVDSALHLGLVLRSELEPECRDARRRRILSECDPRAESGLESIVRVVLRRLGIRAEPQVTIPGVGRVDLLVDGGVVVETDGARFHAGPRRHADHQRDAEVARIGLTPLRFDGAQVHHEIETVVLAIVGALRARRHVRFSGRDARRVRNWVVERLSA